MFVQASPNDYGSFVNATERPGFTYPEYASRFTAELYRPEHWADSFAKSGAQYVVLTSKHHEGFCNWNSQDVPTTWNWNVMDLGPKRDILGDLAVQVRKQVSPQTSQTMKFGIYHSLYEWFNPLYQLDRANNFTTQHFVDSKTLPELYDLVEKYAPEILWSDGDWEAPSQYWKALEFLHWYATNSSVASSGVWNDRWGHEILCQHGSFLTCAE
jgi:alpha-L-fucosidase